MQQVIHHQAATLHMKHKTKTLSQHKHVLPASTSTCCSYVDWKKAMQQRLQPQASAE